MIAHYQILEKLGEGGMGVVYNGIVNVHDVFSEGVQDFIVMEYLSGKPLDRLIPRRGVPLAEALKYALQIVDALATAHARGIIHRDLKTANIIVDDHGTVKVLDFGLAKLAGPPEVAVGVRRA